MENKMLTGVCRDHENIELASYFAGVHTRKTPNSQNVSFPISENGRLIQDFPGIHHLAKLTVNEGFLAVVSSIQVMIK